MSSNKVPRPKGRPPHDLTGQKFGQLEVLHRVPSRPGTPGARWWVRCSCGDEKEVSAHNLTQYLTGSCGKRANHRETIAPPAKNKKHPPINLKDKFSKLTVIGREEYQPGRRVRRYICMCDCGTITKVRAHDLLTLRIKTCGCGRKINRRMEKDGH